MSGTGYPWLVNCSLKYTKKHQENDYLPGSSTRMAGGDGVFLIAVDGSVGRRVVGAWRGDGGVGDGPGDGRGDGSLRDAACDLWASSPKGLETRRASGMGIDGAGLYDCGLKSADRGDMEPGERTPSLSLSDPPKVVGCVRNPGDGGTSRDISTAVS